MPSKTAQLLIGEADVPKPSDMFRQAYPRRGKQGGLKWRVHRVVGVAPTNIDPQEYENWLEALAEANVDNDAPLNEVDATTLESLMMADESPEIKAFLREAAQVMRHTDSDRVAFTTLEGLE
jgi:hypothetical protein